MTAVTTSSISLEGFTAFALLEQSPANTCPAFFAGLFSTITGSVSGTWNAAERAAIFTNAEGIGWHLGGLGTFPVTTSGTLRDTQQTLALDN